MKRLLFVIGLSLCMGGYGKTKCSVDSTTVAVSQPTKPSVSRTWMCYYSDFGGYRTGMSCHSHKHHTNITEFFEAITKPSDQYPYSGEIWQDSTGDKLVLVLAVHFDCDKKGEKESDRAPRKVTYLFEEDAKKIIDDIFHHGGIKCVRSEMSESDFMKAFTNTGVAVCF